jgi:hypothetical protein
MLPLSLATEDGATHARPTAQDLAALVRRIGAPGDRFVVAEAVPDRPRHSIQVWHEDAGDTGYALEWRAGSPDAHFGVTLPTADEVIARMTAWAHQEEGWNAGLDAHRLDLDLPGGSGAGATAEPPAPAAAAEPLTLDEEDRADLEERIREVLLGGYADREDLAELAEDYLVSGDEHPVSPAQARALVDRMWDERLAEQAGWQGETDPERLTRAFASLEAAGITARENFTCCRNCGQAEIGAEAAPGARGFVYFHEQCTDSAASGAGLTLLYGGFDGSAGTTTAVGHEVAAALAAVGLPVEWDGTPSQALTVTPLTWHRRLVG